MVATCRTDAPWSRSFAAFVRLGIVVMLLRIVFQVIFGGPSQGTVVITLPQVDLPEWAAGVSLGGAVTWPELLAAAYDGLRLATMLICVGAANSLANPSRLLKSVPGALYEVGVAVVVALTFAPQLVMHLGRVRQARRLRGRPDRGFRGVRGAAMPVLEGALERSLDLAAAMDSRGYGRRADQPRALRLTTATLTLVGLLGVCIGVYGLLDAASPGVLGLPLLGLGVLLAALGIALGGRRSIRTRYRPDPWRLPEWAVTLSGAAAAAAMTVAADPRRGARPDRRWRLAHSAGAPGGWSAGRAPARVCGRAAPLADVDVGGVGTISQPRQRQHPRWSSRRGGPPMIRFDQVTVTYPGQRVPALRDLDLTIPEGELCLVVGGTGVGKSTLLRLVNGLVPHFTGGVLSGRVTVDGRDTRTHPPRQLADVVGIVGQDPLAGFVTDIVEDELAYGMESLGLAPDVMRKRVEETLDLIGLAHLRTRALRSLSGGERQRVAIGSVLAAHPRVLVLDEPTSALDPGAAEEVLAALQRLVHDLGITVLVSEHRLERVVQYADRVVWLPGDGAHPVVGPPADVMARAAVFPPVVGLGRIAGWDPLPVTVRDARRSAAGLRERLGRHTPDHAPTSVGETVLRTRRLGVDYGRRPALRDVDLQVSSGEIVALMGRNGAGKSSLLNACVGLVRPARGQVEVAGAHDPAALKPSELLHHVGLIPQDAGDLLYAETVADECAQADRDSASPSGSTAAVLTRLAPGIDQARHPRDLSEGQRLCLALAVILVSEPPVLLLDEPTRGLDYNAKAQLADVLRDAAASGAAIVLATHDVELAAEVATRVVVLAEGEVVADGPTAEVVVSSPTFAPQVAKVLAPLPWLTVNSVARALADAS